MVNTVYVFFGEKQQQQFPFHHSLVQASTDRTHKSKVGLMECVHSLVLFFFCLFNFVENSVSGVSFLFHFVTEWNKQKKKKILCIVFQTAGNAKNMQKMENGSSFHSKNQHLVVMFTS